MPTATPIESVAGLLAAVRQLGILDAPFCDELSAGVHGRFHAAEEVLHWLRQRGDISAYQAELLRQDRAQDLELGPYVVIEPLGQGGMGQVYRARHRLMDRQVALKLIHPRLVSDPDSVSRFVREVRAAAQLSHPNIVMAFDAAEVGHTHFLAMEYCPGIDLEALVRLRGPLPVAGACECVRQAATGLQHAFERGMVHRDIKPSNLLLTRVSGGSARGDAPGGPQPATWMVKILDLGLARLCDPGTARDRSTLTEDGHVLGTPDFLAPEQARNAHAADVRSDLYSLGATLYYLLAGHVPYPGGSTVEKLLRHQLEDPPPLPHIRSDIPSVVHDVVRRLMARQPGDRFQTPIEVVAAVQPFADRAALEALGAACETTDPETRIRALPTADSLPNDSPTATSPSLPPLRLPGDREVAPHSHASRETPPGAGLGQGEPPAPLQPGTWPGAVGRVASHATAPRYWRRGVIPGAVVSLAIIAVWLASWWVGRPKPSTTASPASAGNPPTGAGAQLASNAGRKWRPNGTYIPDADAACVAFSPDGRLLAVGCGVMAQVAEPDSPGHVRIWNLATREAIGPELEFAQPVRCLAFAPDSRTVAFGTGNWNKDMEGRIVLWDARARKQRVAFTAHPRGVYAVAVHRDGKFLATGGRDQTLKIWDAGTGSWIADLSGHTGAINSVAFSHDGRWLASAGEDRTVRLWQVDGWKAHGALQGVAHQWMMGLSFSPDDATLVAAVGVSQSMGAELRFWDVRSKLLRRQVCHGDYHVFAVAFAPDGESLVTGCQDGYARIWNASAGTEPEQALHHESAIMGLAYSPDGRQICTVGGWEMPVRLWTRPAE